MTNDVKFFRDTTPYINMHRGRTFVVAMPGEGIAHENFSHVIQDIALLNSLGVRIVLVHGARPQIEARLQQGAIPSKFHAATRVTDADTMTCVKEAAGSIRIAIESLLSMGLVNSPMHGARIRVVSGNFITAKPLGIRDGIDFHHTGEVRRVDRSGIKRQLDDGAIVLLSPIGYSPTGEAFNLSAEDVATQTAISLNAEKLIIFSAQSGIQNAEGALQKIISLHEIGGWMPRLPPALAMALQAAYDACLNGVPRSHIIGFSEDGALLGELFTREGAGTLIVKDGTEIIRQASIDDVGGILELIAPLEEQGVLVKRSREVLETEIARFYVLVHPEGMIVCCAALYPLPGSQSAELACVATHPDYHNQGLASRLLLHVEEQARALQLDALFVLTTQAAHWFMEKGFKSVTLDALPASKAQLYNFQRNSKIFQKNI